jgi:hypothetical protein
MYTPQWCRHVCRTSEGMPARMPRTFTSHRSALAEGSCARMRSNVLQLQLVNRTVVCCSLCTPGSVSVGHKDLPALEPVSHLSTRLFAV